MESLSRYIKNLRGFIHDVLKKEAISAYKLSGMLRLNENVIPQFLAKSDRMLSSKAFFALADRYKVKGDDIIGRVVHNRSGQEISKKDNIEHSDIVPRFLQNIPVEDMQSVMAVREESHGFRHKKPEKKPEKIINKLPKTKTKLPPEHGI